MSEQKSIFNKQTEEFIIIQSFTNKQSHWIDSKIEEERLTASSSLTHSPPTPQDHNIFEDHEGASTTQEIMSKMSCTSQERLLSRKTVPPSHDNDKEFSCSLDFMSRKILLKWMRKVVPMTTKRNNRRRMEQQNHQMMTKQNTTTTVSQKNRSPSMRMSRFHSVLILPLLLLLLQIFTMTPVVVVEAAFLNKNHNNNNNNKDHLKIPPTTPAIGRLKLRAAPTSEGVRARLLKQLGKLREKDRQTKVLRPTELKVVYEDHDLVIVDKPSGVLCVPSEEGIPSLAQTVYETVDHSLSSYDRMVVHRLGMDTSGLVLFAKTMDALRGMNALFRTRKVTREYEVLVCGHVTHTKEGTIDMPLMRDYEFPPYMRVSTELHQQSLIHLDAAIVGKKLLEAPKPSQTHFEVLKHEELKVSSDGGGDDDDIQTLPVTRLKLTSITGRTHQLNVHCAAFGHPIVADRVYGFNGDASPNGGLTLSDFDNNNTGDDDDDADAGDNHIPTDNSDNEGIISGSTTGTLVRSIDAASIDLQRQIAKAAADMPMCVHAKRLHFYHPVTNKEISISSPAVF